jgi:hypothetical protein
MGRKPASRPLSAGFLSRNSRAIPRHYWNGAEQVGIAETEGLSPQTISQRVQAPVVWARRSQVDCPAEIVDLASSD